MWKHDEKLAMSACPRHFILCKVTHLLLHKSRSVIREHGCVTKNELSASRVFRMQYGASKFNF
jgi:hypothetical protein